MYPFKLLRLGLRRFYLKFRSWPQPMQMRVFFAALLVIIIACYFVVKYTVPTQHFLLKHKEHSTRSNLITEATAKPIDVSNLRLDLFISSFYYYPLSASLGDNAFAIVFTAPNEAIHLGHLDVEAFNKTHSVRRAVPVSNITIPDRCKWTVRQLIGSALPNMRKFEIILQDERVAVPFRYPTYRKHDTVTCVSPVFAAEQWQEFTFAAHVYRRFGTHMHLYVRSATTAVLKLMQAYEKYGYLTLQSWPRVRILTVDEEAFNPNRHAGNRNQNGAQNDCLLQYKESAQFISFVDIDDVLIPRVKPTYLDEYLHLFQRDAKASYLWYTKRNIEIRAQRDPVDFSLTQFISSINSLEELEYGKSVVNSYKVNSTWIHHPTSGSGYIVGQADNLICHLRYKDDDHRQADNATIVEPPYNREQPELAPILTTSHVAELQADFMRMRGTAEVAAVWETLPQAFLHFEIVKECYYSKFYRAFFKKRGSMEFCTGPEMCALPALPGVNCSNADAHFFSSLNSTHVNLHFYSHAGFRTSDRCKA